MFFSTEKRRKIVYLASLACTTILALKLLTWKTHNVIGELPSQVHLALSEDPSSMIVNWASSKPSNACQVKYGNASGVYSEVAEASYHQYVSTWDSYTSPYLFSATMKNLNPSTTYYYRVGDLNTNLWSREYSFNTISGNSTNGIQIITYGDQGNTAAANGLINIMKERPTPDFVFHVGDISYANGDTPIWDDYMSFIEPLASSIPYMVCPGNHETKNGENFVPYSNLFSMPNNKFWYSFNYGAVHIIALSTEHPYDAASEQYSFLVQDLKNVNRTEQPWIFVYAHKPPYNSNANYGSFLPIRQFMQPLLSEYSVDLAIFGHEHSYERTFPLDKDGNIANSASGYRDDPYYNLANSPIYFVVGTGGEGLRNEWESPAPAWSKHREASHHGYASIYVQGSEYLHLQFVRDDNTVGDEMYICKNPPCDFGSDPNGGGVVNENSASGMRAGMMMIMFVIVMMFL